MKVCLLVRENAFHWSPFYVQAFREVCDEAVTIGQACDLDAFSAKHWTNAPRHVARNDIITDADDALEIIKLLPRGWSPDLVVGIQSGGHAYRNLRRLPCPTAYISVDTWHAPQEFHRALQYDFVFAAQPVFVPYFEATGAREVSWLPLAASPEHHFFADTAKQHDIVFVGTVEYRANVRRRERLLALGEYYDVAVFSDVDPANASHVYGSGKLGFNSSICCDVNMRVFEVMAMKQPLFTNRNAEINGLTLLFEEGKHFIGYTDLDLIQQAQCYLEDETRRHEIAEAGHRLVLERHCYTHRVHALLDHVKTKTGSASDHALRQGDRLSAYLPPGTTSILDIGLGLDKTRIALGRSGVTLVHGASRDSLLAQKHARRYDTVFDIQALDVTENPTAYDVVCVSEPAREFSTYDALLRTAQGCLVAGGTLLLKLNAGDHECLTAELGGRAFDAYLHTRGLHLLCVHPLSAGLIVEARAFNRTVDAVSMEIYERFPPNM